MFNHMAFENFIIIIFNCTFSNIFYKKYTETCIHMFFFLQFKKLKQKVVVIIVITFFTPTVITIKNANKKQRKRKWL